MEHLVSMFEVATRERFRFQFKGLISVEDLWQLSVSELDSVFKTLNSQVKAAKEESLLDKKTQEDEILDLQIKIVKHIVTTKLEEESARLNARAQKAKKQKILAILSSKEETALENKSVEELENMLSELDN